MNRNVINLLTIRQNIASFVSLHHFSKEIEEWLLKNLLRWMVRYYKYLLVVQSVERYKTLMNTDGVPSWFVPNQQETQYVYIRTDVEDFKILLTRCSEYLSSIPMQKHKFYKMTPDQVLANWTKEHERIQKRKNSHIKTSSEALLLHFRYETYSFYRFDSTHKELSLEMAKESSYMQHCLGEFENIEHAQGGYGAYYHEQITERRILLYTMRDENNNPHATISTYADESGNEWVEQIKGKQNRAPVNKYREAIVAFLNHCDIRHSYHSDCMEMDMIYSKGQTKHISTVKDQKTQQFIVSRIPSKITQLPNPSPSTQWIALSRDPELVKNLLEYEDATKLYALMMKPKLLSNISDILGKSVKKLLKEQVYHEYKNRKFSFGRFKIGRI